jgi:hypothetical protein
MGLLDVFNCDVKVGLRHKVFFPGNIVQGVAFIDVIHKIEVSAIRIVLCGKEVVEYRQRNLIRGEIMSRTTSEESKFLECLLTVAGPMKSTGESNSVALPVGSYSYPFVFQLPLYLPPSFSLDASNGKAAIKYYVKAYVEIPFGKNAEAKCPFNVLTGIPRYQWLSPAPVSATRSFDVKFCCCVEKGHVGAALHLDRTVIAIDRDNLTVCADVDNTAGEEPVESLEISLNHVTQFMAMGHIERDTTRAGHVFIREGIEAGSKGRIVGTVPLFRGLAPTFTSFHIRSEYSLQIELNIPMASDPSTKFTVLLAHIVDDSEVLPPVDFNTCRFMMLPSSQANEIFYVPPADAAYPLKPIPSLPPPSNPVQTAAPLFSTLPPQGQQWGADPGVQPVNVATNVPWQGPVSMNEMSPAFPVPPPPSSTGFQQPPPMPQPLGVVEDRSLRGAPQGVPQQQDSAYVPRHFTYEGPSDDGFNGEPYYIPDDAMYKQDAVAQPIGAPQPNVKNATDPYG